MRSFIRTKVMTIALAGIIMGACVASAHASHKAISADTVNTSSTNSLRSAFLGPDVWEDGLSSTEVKQQLQEHFAQVIERLESTNATSLLRALIRAEASTAQPWTKAQRREALIYLATNRQRQIARLRYYMNRGLFPQNEGQSKSAVPIFVDRRQTHCAVGFLMHSDGKDSGVASIVKTNNLVRVNNVRRGSMVHWIRSSGLTQEEAALIQPGYPSAGYKTFDELSTPNATVQGNGFVVSEVTFRTHRFDTTLPTNFQSDPTALQAIFDLGKAGIEANNLREHPDNIVLQFFAGLSLDHIRSPGNLDESLYIGTSDEFSSQFPIAAPNTISEVDYMIRSEQSDFSEIALTGGISFDLGDADLPAFLLLSQIYDGDTNELLGEMQLSQIGGGFLSGTDSIELATDFVRIKSYALVVGDEARINSFFHEFETSAVPEPGTGSLVILMGAVAGIKRRRRTASN